MAASGTGKHISEQQNVIYQKATKHIAYTNKQLIE